MVDERFVMPRTRREIEHIAATVRAGLALAPDGRVSMLPILEIVLYEIFEGYEFHVREDHEMAGVDGLTDDNRPIIHIANRVYRALERGDGQARMTAAHEFGHLLLHSGAPTFHASADKPAPLYNPERQADIFASAFLMPEAAFRACTTLYRIHHPEASMSEARRLVAEWVDHHVVRAAQGPTPGCACD